MKKYFLLLLLLFSLLSAQAQYFLTGQDPASIKWKQMRTENFRFIFPDNYPRQARYLANLFEHSYQAVRFDLSAPPLRTSVILHNQSVISNAMVAFAPRRVEMYNTPPQDGYAQPWYKQLAIHELRHMAQLSKINTGLTQEIGYLFGEQAVAGIFGLFLPFYFVEGDAVATETALGNSGRGRQPLFEAKLRAQLLEIGYYQHDKAYFGSYRDYTPDVYALGYFVVGHNRAKYGPILWDHTTRNVARKFWTLKPYSSGLKKYSGFRKNALYRETMFDLYEIWKAQYDSLQYTPYEQYSSDNKLYTNYRFPQPLADGSVIATKSALDDVLRIVKVNKGRESIVFTPGPTFRETLSATDSLVVWSEYQADIRWSNRDYAVIKTGNLKTGTIKQLTHKSRFFAPSISADNKKIVVSETDADSRYYLVVLDAAQGEELFRYGSDTLFFQTPVWMPDHLHIVAVVVGDYGKSFIKINTVTGKAEMLLPFTFDDLALSSATDEFILFAGVWSGISNIYAFRFDDQNIYQLTSSAFGASDASLSADGSKIYYADYNSDGFRLATANYNNLLWKPIQQVENNAYQLADALSEMSIYNVDEVIIPDSAYPIRPYSKWRNLFNIHSWTLFHIDAESPEVGPGIRLFSQNELSTAVTELGFHYNLNEETYKQSLSFDYLGWFPVVNFKLNTGTRRGVTELDGETYNLAWWQADWSLGLRVPLNLNRNRWVSGIQPGFRYNQVYRKMDEDVGLNFKQDLIHAFEYDLFAYTQMRSSKRDLYPRLGQYGRFLYRHSAFDNNPAGQFFMSSTTFLPGLLLHHGLRLYAAYQWQQTGLWAFGNAIALPRGYNGLFFSENTSLKADYVFPIAYPDLNLPTVFLLQRLRGGFFGDYFMGRGNQPDAELYSIGLEFFSDWFFLNIPFPVSLGTRVNYLPAGGDFGFEFLFDINLTTLY